MKIIRILPPTYLLCAIILMVQLHFIFPMAILFNAQWNLLGSLAFFLVVVIFTVLMDREFIAVEEQMLAKKFCREWGEYKRRVRRWI